MNRKITKGEFPEMVMLAMANICNDFFTMDMKRPGSRVMLMNISTQFSNPKTKFTIFKSVTEAINWEELEAQNNPQEFVSNIVEKQIEKILIGLASDSQDLYNLKTDWKTRLKFLIFPKVYKNL